MGDPVIERILVTAALLMFGVVAASGCSDLFGPAEHELRVTTDRTAYVATYVDGEGSWRRYRFEAVIRTENVGRAPLFLDTCSSGPGAPIFGVFQVSGDSEGRRGSAFSPAWACPGYPPIELAPGEVRVDTLPLTAPTSVDGITGEVRGSLEGMKEIGFQVKTCSDRAACRAPSHVGRSNAFQVTIASGS